MAEQTKIIRHTSESARLADELLRAMREGRYLPDRPLPSYRELCVAYTVGIRTVRRAMTVLEQEGIVRVEDRKGVFVNRQPSQDSFLVIMPNILNPDHAQLVTALSAAGEARGLHMRLSVTEESRSQPDAAVFERQYIESIESGAVAGVIKAPTTIGKEGETFRRRLREKGFPLVMVNDFYSNRTVDRHVLVNEISAAEAIIDHLVELGHRQMVFGTTTGDHHPVLEGALVRRLAERARTEASLEFLYIGASDFGPVHWAQWERSLEFATAVIAPAHSYCRHAYAIASHFDLSVPEDISIACTGSAPASGLENSGVTCFEMPFAEMADAALDMLLEQGESGKVQQMMFEPQFIQAGSTGPARKERRAYEMIKAEV